RRGHRRPPLHRDRAGPDGRAARPGHGADRSPARQVDPADLPRHRHRHARERGRRRSFLPAMTGAREMQHAKSPRPLTGRTVLICLVAFFGVVIGMNLVMVKLAIDTLPGTDVDSAYKASLAYNAEIHAAEDQAARHWSVRGKVERSADGSAAIRVEARDAAGFPLSGLEFWGGLSRPTDKRADRVVDLGEGSPGAYAGRAADVLAGQWDVVIEAARGGERLFLSRNRIVLN